MLAATEMTLPVFFVAVSAQWSILTWLPFLFWQSVGRVAVTAEAARYQSAINTRSVEILNSFSEGKHLKHSHAPTNLHYNGELFEYNA